MFAVGATRFRYAGRMTAAALSDSRVVTVPPRGRPVAWSLVAAALVLASAALQLVASLERWVVASDSWTRDDVSVEDNLFNYFWPMDPWENLGSTAQFYGAGTLLLALAILAMARAAGAAEDRDTPTERTLARVTAGSFALTGVHALVSGIIGVPTPLQFVAIPLLAGLVGFVCLVVLGIRWLWASTATALACGFLLGSTLPGYFVAGYLIAPALTNYSSYDTTPWTETVVAATTAAGGLALVVAAGVTAIRRARRAATLTPHV